MNIIKLFNSFNIEGKSEEEIDIFMSRKEAFKKMGRWGKNMAIGSIPLGLFAAMPTVAFGRSARAHDVLNYALTLEHLEYNFYKMGVESGVASAANSAIITEIRDNEKEHVDFLTAYINEINQTNPGAEPVMEGTYDFTAGGTYADVFTNEATFLAVAQALEDTGVRAYKGQAGNLMNETPGANVGLTAALQIHSVEARHAAIIRKLRGQKGWVVPDNVTNGVAAGTGTAAVYGSDSMYPNENNTTHGGADVASLGITGVTTQAIQEAWDEALTDTKVLEIAGIFIQA